MDSETIDNWYYYVYYLCVRHTVGKWGNLAWRQFKREWRQSHGWPEHCSVCGVRTKHGKENYTGTLTLDHIIPESVLEELELMELWFEPENFTVMCPNCNLAKGDTMPKFEELSPELLAKLYWSIDERNKRLALAESL